MPSAGGKQPPKREGATHQPADLTRPWDANDGRKTRPKRREPNETRTVPQSLGNERGAGQQSQPPRAGR